MADFTLIDDFFAANVAIHAHAGATDDGFNRCRQLNRLNSQQLVIGNDLICPELREIVAWFFGYAGISLFAHIQTRGNPHCPTGPHIDERCRDFAVVFHAQRAMSNRATRGRLDPIGKTTVGLADDQEPLIIAWHNEIQRSRAS